MSFHLTPINQRMGKIGNQKCLIWPESIVQLSLIYSHLPALFHFQRSAEQEQPQQHNAIITIGIVCVPIETRPVSVTRCMKQDTGSSSTLARAPKMFNWSHSIRSLLDRMFKHSSHFVRIWNGHAPKDNIQGPFQEGNSPVGAYLIATFDATFKVWPLQSCR